jgi:hypothetical protein
MIKMEVFLSEEVIQYFSALQHILSNTNTDGFLIGHKRGNLFYVEKIFPSQKGFFPSVEEYLAIKQNLADRILGFYSYQVTENKLKKILAPMAYGKIFLRFDRDEGAQWVIKPFIIEHRKDFFMQPIELNSVR